MVFIQMFFLIYLLYTAEKYLVMKISSKEHRLLPVIIVLAGLFNFYRVVECVTDANDVFVLLEQLLVFQAMFGVIHYKKDCLRIKFFPGGNLLLFGSLVFFDAALVLGYWTKHNIDHIYAVFVSIYIAVLLAMDIYIWIFVKLKKREQLIANTILFSSVLVLISGIIAEPTQGGWGMIWTPLALFIVEIAMNLLMKSGYIVDSAYLLKEQMYDDSEIATILFDEDGYFLDMNEAASIAFPELMPRDRKDVGQCYAAELENLLAKENKNDEIEIRGCVYRMHLAQEEYMGHIRGYILYLVDLTQEKQENQLMESLMQKAKSATIMKSRFLASMSHELRSPLHAIIGFCDILNRQADISSHYKSMIGNIHNAGDTLLRLVNSILDYSKMEAGKIELKMEPFDFEQMLKSILQESIVNRQNKPIEITIHMKTAYPHILIGDEIHVRDIIQNLMANAVKYTNEGSIECDISCKTLEDSKVRITVCVKDTGIGMSEEQVRVVFDEYTSFVGDKSVEGTGLGLPIVRGFAEMMDGEVTAQSDGKTGSVFTATFSLSMVDGKQCPPQLFTEETLRYASEEAGVFQRPDWFYPQARVLVVDDMSVNLELFQEYADIWKLKIDTATNGEEAIRKVRERRYEMVFLDNMMPKMTGIEAASIIRTFSEIPIIILTADISEETRHKSMENGATELLEKPLRLEELKKILEGHLSESLRQPVTETEISVNMDDKRKKILHIFAKEAEGIRMDIMECWKKEDLELFRIKVHGLKGTSRGIGRMELSEKAEVMEMAARTENHTFIERHLEKFNDDIVHELERIKEEISDADSTQIVEINDSENREITESAVSIDQLFAQLQKQFENYDLTGIEQCLEELEHRTLSVADRQLLHQVREASEELEYEAGSELLLRRS